MLWHLVLPFKITFWTLGIALGIAVLAAPALQKKRSRIFLWGFPMVLVSFIPSCSLVMHFVDKSRFGVFEYDVTQTISDPRVERYLPTDAREVTVDRFASGYRARYLIESDVLEDWFDAVWEEFGEYSVNGKSPPEFITVTNEIFDRKFSGLGWPRPSEVVFYQGPIAENGAGFAIWYDAETGFAYETATHW
ncbi:hypothetical protein N9B38_03175 [bacterium]|nr:hypothetical protein [bacterium]